MIEKEKGRERCVAIERSRERGNAEIEREREACKEEEWERERERTHKLRKKGEERVERKIERRRNYNI